VSNSIRTYCSIIIEFPSLGEGVGISGSSSLSSSLSFEGLGLSSLSSSLSIGVLGLPSSELSLGGIFLLNGQTDKKSELSLNLPGL
jgi:hypothetical protein